tara:strand:- start:273 stop:941 length:669 start_codon:yes stop_codon:yes gene_type:complete
MKHVVLGWARGGLGYITELLRSSGTDIHVGTTFGPDTTAENLEQRLSTAKDYEVSPYIVPFLGHPAFKGVRVTFVARDPMRVLNSLYFLGLFHNEKKSDVARFAYDHVPNLKANYLGCPHQASSFYLWRWLHMGKVNAPHTEIVRLEEGPRQLLSHFNLNNTGKYIDPYKNSSYCKQNIRPSDSLDACNSNMVKLLKTLGYLQDAWFPKGGHAHYINPDWHC